MTNVAIFVSGGGTNCERLIEYFKGSEDVNIAVVLSNRADAHALVRARNHGVPAVVMKREDIAKREVMGAFLKEYSIDFIVLAGFLVVVPDFLVNEYSGRMINLHPALLPRHGGPGMYGHHVHEAVKACGETETGMTVHWVSNEVDGGRIIARFRTAVELSDTPEEIAGKEHELEMAWFSKVVEQTILSLRSS
ncbi:MAG: phosphoribosylglycinamide formyltransferase [Bacteroidales bacterium]|nr:phosphoribosylglycinamide formyltransferase [Bacteroidales bacterium]